VRVELSELKVCGQEYVVNFKYLSSNLSKTPIRTTLLFSHLKSHW
jgi:hypothetical protein